MNENMLTKPSIEDLLIVVIDVQERLMAAMPPEIGNNVLKNISILITAADLLHIPVIYTEQYPKGLGKTCSTIQNILLKHGTSTEKICFSCCDEDAFNRQLSGLNRKQVIITGVEAHVCVLQTVLDLLRREYCAYVIKDAVCSRHKVDWKTALEIADKAGAQITTTEIILFQLLGRAGTEEFKRIQNLLK